MSIFFTADLCPNNFIGIDSFEGVSEPSNFDSDYFKKYDLKVPYEIAKNNLSRFNNVNLIKGWIPEVFDKLKDSRYSFVHIDVDLYEPTLKSVEYFWDKIISGGIMVCDDYGSSKTIGARKAIDDFFGSNKVIELTTGQAIIIKI
jgi:O-methyltransferase